MKKNLLYLFILLLLGFAVYYFVFMKGSSTLPVNEKNFAVEDTANIGKIFIADMSKNSVTLERGNNGEWLINQKFFARPDAMQTLLSTIKQLSIKYPVAEAARNNALKSLATNNCKVEIYDLQNNLINAYYVGGGTNDNNGTFMKTLDGENPYVVSFPGFHGVLTVRYITDVEDLRTRNIFSFTFNQMKEVSVHYFGNEDSSFIIHVAGVDSFQLMNFKTHSAINPKLVSKDRMGMYLALFRFINAEAFENNNKGRDSILAQQPFCEISVTDVSGKNYKATCYYKPVTEGSLQQFSSKGEALKYDVDHYYATINDGQDFVLIQQFHFGRLFQKINFFSAKSAGRK
ncbi:MAG: hypothetical protein WCI97_02405 [Bacteroidota bacterium]